MGPHLKMREMRKNRTKQKNKFVRTNMCPKGGTKIILKISKFFKFKKKCFLMVSGQVMFHILTAIVILSLQCLLQLNSALSD